MRYPAMIRSFFGAGLYKFNMGQYVQRLFTQ